jgi:hypothetical protein
MPTRVTDPDLLAQLNAPDRSEVAPTPKVWGDAEAEQAGLYEQSATAAPPPKPVSDPAILAQLNGQGSPFGDRFQQPAPPANAGELESGLRRLAMERTRGPATPPMLNAAIDVMNQRSGAMQGATPNIEAQYPNLLSTEVYQNDAGDIQYKDPATGQIVTTDQSKHVTFRDPADNTLKVFARTPETNEGPVVGAARTLAHGVMAGAPTARAAVGAAKSIQPAASDILATAKPYYRAFKEGASKIDLPGESGKVIAEHLRTSLGNANLIPELAQPVYSAIGILEKEGPLTLDALQNIKRVVGRSFSSPDKNVRDAAAVASKEINNIISVVSAEAGKNLKTADQIHSTARSVQDLQRKEAVADLRAGRAGYGGNAVNTMRQVLSPIVQKATEGRVTGFQPAEIAAMREIVEGTTATNALRLAGQASPTKGVFQTGGAVAGTAALGPAALAIPAVGMASNKLATILTGRQIEHLKELVAKRSPAYAAAVEKAVDRYERAQRAFSVDPSPNRFASYLQSSRALAAGLTRDGVQVSSGDLLRAIQGPMRGAAEDEQP